jgi:hypothetical protein
MDEEIDRMRRQSLQTHSSEIQRGEVDRATGAASPEKRGSAEKRANYARIEGRGGGNTDRCGQTRGQRGERT